MHEGEEDVLYLLTWEFTDTSEASNRRSLAVFQQWEPAKGAEFLGFYAYADNSGGAAVVEADSHATLARLSAPFTSWLTFRARPLIPIQESAAINLEAIAFVETVP